MKLLAILFGLLLAGCATISPMMPETQCATTDWEKVGFQDGSRGEAPDYADNHRYACRSSQNPLDESLYATGRERGLRQYCTPEGLYDAGQTGQPYRGVCDKKLEGFWQQGREHDGLVRERRDAQDALARRQKELNDDHSVVGDISKGIHLLSGESQTASEQDRIDRINDKIYKSEKLAPPGARRARDPDAEMQMKVLGAMRPLLAGMMGGIVGFGSGHAIMGTYLDRGYIFTALDTAVIGSLFVISHNCPSSKDPVTGENRNSTNTGCTATTAAFILTFLGVRIWEGIDAARSPVSVALLPVGDTVGPGLIARW